MACPLRNDGSHCDRVFSITSVADWVLMTMTWQQQQQQQQEQLAAVQSNRTRLQQVSVVASQSDQMNSRLLRRRAFIPRTLYVGLPLHSGLIREHQLLNDGDDLSVHGKRSTFHLEYLDHDHFALLLFS